MKLVKFVADFFRNVKSLTAVDARGTGGWFSVIREGFAGAWQANVTLDSPRNILAFSAVFSCVTGIATDVAKLGSPKLLIWNEQEQIYDKAPKNSPHWKVLRKPNHYQTWFKFIEQWIVSKLLHGAAYVLKQRDNRNMVVALYVLDPTRVTPLVAENGDVYYRCARDDLSEVPESYPAVPASEMIHDMMVSLWHPLVGVSPIYACGLSATMGNKIQANSLKFFGNMSRPSGGLTSDNTITNETAERLKRDFEEKFGGANVGRLFIAGDGLKYVPMTMPAQDAQLIEQLKWTVEDVARAFHYPMFKLGGPLPVRASVESDQQTYYSDCLQGLIESAEALLTEGLSVPDGYCVEFDLDGLLRMDTAALITAEAEAVKGGIKAPDEARRKFNLRSVKGGDTPYLQQQNYSLGALAKRDAKDDPFATAAPSRRAGDGAPIQPVNNRAMMEEFVEIVSARLKALPLSLPAPVVEEQDELEEIADIFVAGLEG